MVGFSDAKISDAKTGLELDKMEIPAVSRRDSAGDGGYRGVQQRSLSAGASRKHSILKILLLVSGVLLPFVLMFLLWDQGFVDLPLLESKKAQRELERYATVGPVMTSIGQNQHIKLTVQIECKDTRLKKKITGISSAIKSKLLVILSSPEVKDKLRLQDYASLKSYFKEEIDSLLQKESVEAVYFSDIVRY